MTPVLRPLALAALLLSCTGAKADDVAVMISGGFKSTYQALLPGFEAASGDHVTTLPGPSMGTTHDAIPQRLARGEPDDVLIMVGSALDALVADGKAVPGSRVDLALSPIGMAVKAGAPVPDIGTVDKLRAALLAARSVAYSDSASGVYIRDELFKRLGIEAEMQGKARMIPATPVAEIVARGEAELGFQQVAELLPVPGIAFAGKLPEAVQKNTVFSAGIAVAARHPAAGRALVAYMASPAAAPVMARMGLDPAKH
ncbi:substrate-binding domain-containing protein [Lichenibacterium ramalinae]|uniref:ABC transporter substrate-binding protein n=1 Tax=Lichenibacterium ramalinae TaxID=2316527 RepID=A0A4Q2R7N4_9HYPH|nr:substrate-binding domain-containing protein [Lichenibacterium ramalinae]RYB01971.1 ABC transporter substrate-binding protein [Lichenibacterium ramalinae]